MAEKEKPEIEPHILNPDHWDGHGPEDNCEWKEVSGGKGDVPLRKELGAPGFGRKILREFFDAEQAPIRIFSAGELFDANQYPEGTIIKYEDERLFIQNSMKELMEDPYRKKNYWGVVYGYDQDDQRMKTLVSFAAMEPWNFFSMGRVTRPTIRVREVDHVRIDRKDYKGEALERVNGLVLYSIGKGVREKEKRGLRFPEVGVIFGKKPQPEA